MSSEPKQEMFPRDYFLNRLVKASGVPKEKVRKVIAHMPEVIYGLMAECKRFQVCDGIILEGVKKADDKRTVYIPAKGKKIQSKTFIRPTCTFGKNVKTHIVEAYEKKYGKKEEQSDDKDK